MAKKSKLKATPKFLVLLIVVAMGFACVIFFSQEQKLKEIRAERSVLDKQYKDLQSEEQLTEYMIQYAESEEYKIQYAREKLGYVKPDDIKFSIDEENDNGE